MKTSYSLYRYLFFLLYLCFYFSISLAGNDRKEKKYYATGGYGVGKATWYSQLRQSDIFDKNGAVVNSGNLKFKAHNNSSVYLVEVAFPVADVRLGIGINFENFFLDKLELNTRGNKKILVFDESFRFDKIYGTLEIPWINNSHRGSSVNFNSRFGYFGITGLDRINFFGVEAIAKTYFIGGGILADLRLFPHVHIFINPYLEYKYFKNSPLEIPSVIRHNIITFSCLGGLRFDVSRKKGEF